MEPSALPDWPRAYGGTLFSAKIRAQPADFQVSETLGWAPSGDGEHDFLLIQKTGANTDWVAKQLASHAQLPARDVGYAGLKDRHAVTRQWFSVPRWHNPDWRAAAIEGVEILEIHRHLRKLRRGAHARNVFKILLRDLDHRELPTAEARLRSLRDHGVPNYFGEQRFGRRGANLQLAHQLAVGRRLSRQQRSLAISTIRSYAFNSALAARVSAGNWHTLIPGDMANLEGSASVFAIDQIDDTLRSRCEAMDIHPALALAAVGSGIEPAAWQQALDKARVESATRSLRICVGDLASTMTPEGLWLEFTLPRGAFATAVLRELCNW